MIVSRPEFVRRFVNAFGDVEDGEQYLFCFRTKMPDNTYFYAVPFVISRPLDLYYHLCNVDGAVIDKLVEQYADIVQLVKWSDEFGLVKNNDSRSKSASFVSLFLDLEVVD